MGFPTSGEAGMLVEMYEYDWSASVRASRKRPIKKDLRKELTFGLESSAWYEGFS
jgi:hypothetical protein